MSRRKFRAIALTLPRCARVRSDSLTKIVNLPASFWRIALPRKVMVRSYFAESKGVVGCHYKPHLAFKVRDWMRFSN